MSDFVEILSPSALKDLEKANAELLTMVANVDKVGQKMKTISNPSGSDGAMKDLNEQYIKQQKLLTSLQLQLERYAQAQNRTKISNNSLEKSEISLTKAKEAHIRTLEREQAKLAASQNLYNKTQQQLNVVQAAYNNLAVKKERYNNLTAQEEQRLITLGKVTERYNSTLKAVDATVGKHTRNVGNYASGFNPLSNSINQLTREMPAFTNSVQTGFMALSNNIPIFTDAIGNAIRQNKELIAQGQPTKSVLSQVASSLFSFQTLLGVGITLLTVYGKEIGEWVQNLWGASDALDEINKRQDEFNKGRVTGRKDAQSEIIELEKYISVAKNASLSDEERNIALKALRSQYPFYFKELSDNAILTGNIKEAEDKLREALEKRKAVEAKTAVSVKNRQDRIDLEEQLAVLTETLPALRERLKLRQEQAKGDAQFSGALASAQNKLNSALKEQLKAQTALDLIIEKEANNQKEIVQLKAETIGLEYQEDKQRKKKIKQIEDLNFEMQDFLANQYELIKQQKTLEAQALEGIFKDEGNSLDQRLTAYDAFISKKIELANDEYNENLRLQKKATDEEKADLNERYQEFIKTEGVTAQQRIDAKKELNSALASLDKKSALEIELIQLNHGVKIVDITKKTNDEILKLKRETSTLEAQKEINEKELKDLDQFNLKLAGISKKTTKKRLDDIAKFEKDFRQRKQRELIELELKNLSEELENTQENSEEKTKLQIKYFAKRKELLELDTQIAKEEYDKQTKYLADIASYLNGFLNDFAGNTGFKTLIKILNDEITGFGENTKVTINAVAEAFQELGNFLSKQGEERFQREFERLAMEKEIALQFAGESAVAKEAIEKQYEQRRLVIERKKAEQEKKTAIFNAIIDTAQAVVAALPNIPLSLLVGAIGAAQIGFIASQPLPAFATGTDNAPEGYAWTQEKGAEIITDKNGKVKSLGSNKGAQLTYMNKGDKVFTASESSMMFDNGLNNILSNNGIMPNIVINQNDNSKLEAGLKAIENTIKNKEGFEFTRDERGDRIYKKSNGQRIEMLNTRLKIKGFDV